MVHNETATSAVADGPGPLDVVGFAAVPNWLVRHPDATAFDKLIYLTLASHAGMNGTWSMTHVQIAAESGTSVATVKRALDSLRAWGLVSWSPRIDPATKARLGNLYRITFHPEDPSSRGATPQLTESYPLAQGELGKKNPIEEPIPPTPLDDDHGFAAVWEAWPRKDNRKMAERNWRRLTVRQRNEVTPKLIAHANAHRLHTPPKFIPMLSTWLNQERWDDPVPVAQDRGGRAAEPERRQGIVIPAGHVPVRDENGNITGSRPA